MNQVVLALGNVKAFRGYSVTLGTVVVSDDEFVKHLDDTYTDVVICNIGMAPGSVLQQVSPFTFEREKRDFQEELQTSLQSQMRQGNDVDIDFYL